MILDIRLMDKVSVSMYKTRVNELTREMQYV